MPFNVLFLPLLGGYIFISYWHRTRFDAKRYRGERLLFHSAVAGLVFLVVAFIITTGTAALWPALASWWKGHVPFVYSGTSFLALGLAAGAAPVLNQFLDRDKEATKAVQEWGDVLEMLFVKGMAENKQLSLSLSSGKVYVGFVTSAFDPSFERKYVMLMPTLSGYRDATTKTMVITHDYSDAYERLLQEDKEFEMRMADEFQLVIPISEIVTANLFDPVVYELFLDVEEGKHGA